MKKRNFQVFIPFSISKKSNPFTPFLNFLSLASSYTLDARGRFHMIFEKSYTLHPKTFFSHTIKSAKTFICTFLINLSDYYLFAIQSYVGGVKSGKLWYFCIEILNFCLKQIEILFYKLENFKEKILNLVVRILIEHLRGFEMSSKIYFKIDQKRF
jgi:hypothetical protein